MGDDVRCCRHAPSGVVSLAPAPVWDRACIRLAALGVVPVAAGSFTQLAPCPFSSPQGAPPWHAAPTLRELLALWCVPRLFSRPPVVAVLQFAQFFRPHLTFTFFLCSWFLFLLALLLGLVFVVPLLPLLLVLLPFVLILTVSVLTLFLPLLSHLVCLRPVCFFLFVGLGSAFPHPLEVRR